MPQLPLGPHGVSSELVLLHCSRSRAEAPGWSSEVSFPRDKDTGLPWLPWPVGAVGSEWAAAGEGKLSLKEGAPRHSGLCFPERCSHGQSSEASGQGKEAQILLRLSLGSSPRKTRLRSTSSQTRQFWDWECNFRVPGFGSQYEGRRDTA